MFRKSKLEGIKRVVVEPKNLLEVREEIFSERTNVIEIDSLHLVISAIDDTGFRFDYEFNVKNYSLFELLTESIERKLTDDKVFVNVDSAYGYFWVKPTNSTNLATHLTIAGPYERSVTITYGNYNITTISYYSDKKDIKIAKKILVNNQTLVTKLEELMIEADKANTNIKNVIKLLK